jgi:hypothetical protein
MKDSLGQGDSAQQCKEWILEHPMHPFPVAFKPISPVSEWLVYAVKKALIFGQLQTGDKSPPVQPI